MSKMNKHRLLTLFFFFFPFHTEKSYLTVQSEFSEEKKSQ